MTKTQTETLAEYNHLIATLGDHHDLIVTIQVVSKLQELNDTMSKILHQLITLNQTIRNKP